MNPAVALGAEEHALITSAQRLAGLLDNAKIVLMTASENATTNVAILRTLGDSIGLSGSMVDNIETAVNAFIGANGL